MTIKTRKNRIGKNYATVLNISIWYSESEKVQWKKGKDIAENDKITAVARKTDLDEKTANISKIKQFSNYKGKEHSVEGEVYCVNAGYNRDGCIKQIERMLIVCGGNSNDFKITKAPHKSTHSASKSGKKDIGEILNA